MEALAPLRLIGARNASASDGRRRAGRCGPAGHRRDRRRPQPGGCAANSPGVLSGNVIQIPLDLGLNLCGNSLDLLSLLNPATGKPARTAEPADRRAGQVFPCPADGHRFPVDGRLFLADGDRFERVVWCPGGRLPVLADGRRVGARSPVPGGRLPVLADGCRMWWTGTGSGGRLPASAPGRRSWRRSWRTARLWRTVVGLGEPMPEAGRPSVLADDHRLRRVSSVLADGCPFWRTVAGYGERLSDMVDGHRTWRTATATASVPDRRSW